MDPFDPEELADRYRMSDRDRATLTATLQVASGAPKIVLASSAFDVPLVDADAEMTPDAPGRYEDRGSIGTGGMGVVRRVFDRTLNRVMAMKIIRSDRMDNPSAFARFLLEAQTHAQLQHPGIVPVYELGRLEDGRPYFTMKEVRGRTMADVIEEVHEASNGAWRASAAGWTLRRLVSAFHQVCSAVAFAHRQGVIHRDLKPSNVMLGEFGEALVMDWGLAKVQQHVDHAAEAGELDVVSTSNPGMATEQGQVSGTPAFMSPEQARGDVAAIDARSDVYALGTILYVALSGRPPYGAGGGPAIVRLVLEGPPEPPLRPDGVAAPDELVEICQRAMARAPGDRFPSATELADEVLAWLEGVKARERALEVVRSAEAKRDEADRLRSRADKLKQEARVLLAKVRPWQPEEIKAPAWTLADEATELIGEAAMRELEYRESLRVALNHAPGLPEAHAGLADFHLERHREAEDRRDTGEAARLEALTRLHDTQGRHAAYLKGDGALSLRTDPPGAEVLLHRYDLHHRRLVPVFERSLGTTPLDRVPLPRGSYLCVIRHPERAEVRYPVRLGRSEHWDGIAPGDTEGHAVRLPLQGAIAADEAYVPHGWFWAGGDPMTSQGLERQRVWIDAMVADRFMVTNRQYVAFLDDLVAQGREEEALRWVPRERAGKAGEQGAMIYGRTQAGRFRLVTDADGDAWQPDWPVTMVDWWCARAYAGWRSARGPHRWRLLGELEWEKAARGVDGRYYPWGDVHDPSWCHMSESHQGKSLMAVVDSYPIDASPYGLRGLGGNVRTWCRDPFTLKGPALTNGRAPPVPDLGDPDADILRGARGGAWMATGRRGRSANRGGLRPGFRRLYIGFRLARSL